MTTMTAVVDGVTYTSPYYMDRHRSDHHGLPPLTPDQFGSLELHHPIEIKEDQDCVQLYGFFHIQHGFPPIGKYRHSAKVYWVGPIIRVFCDGHKVLFHPAAMSVEIAGQVYYNPHIVPGPSPTSLSHDELIHVLDLARCFTALHDVDLRFAQTGVPIQSGKQLAGITDHVFVWWEKNDPTRQLTFGPM